MKRAGLIVMLGLAGALGACAAQEAANRQPVFRVVEENASVSNRHLVRRIAVLEDDTLLIEAGASELYQVTLAPGCANVSDVMAPVQVSETSMGIDRSTRFIIGGDTCFVRRIDRVERITPAERAAAAAEAASAEGDAAGAN